MIYTFKISILALNSKFFYQKNEKHFSDYFHINISHKRLFSKILILNDLLK